MTPLKLPYIDHRYFWPNFLSLTLNFNEVIRFQVHSPAAADCHATQIMVKNTVGIRLEQFISV